MIQANLGDQLAIFFITGIITIWIPVTSIYFEDAPLGAIKITRPPIRILIAWERKVTLASAKGVRHVPAVLTQGLILSAASRGQSYATVIVAWEERPIFRA